MGVEAINFKTKGFASFTDRQSRCERTLTGIGSHAGVHPFVGPKNRLTS